MQAGAIATQAISRMSHAAKHTKDDGSPPKETPSSPPTKPRPRQLWPFSLTSFRDMIDLTKLAALGLAFFDPGNAGEGSSEDHQGIDGGRQQGASYGRTWAKASEKVHEKKHL